MRTPIAALVVALSISTTLAGGAEAAPTQVNVRIEGKGETLFEGPILTAGHNVKAASDVKAPGAGRRCNGLNNGQNPTPGPTPTAASVDAMALLGEDFDGKWYPEPFEDYFITRWGPDGQDGGKGEYWGVVVNNVFTSVGGCQYKLDGGDEVTWVYDAFKDRPSLALFPAGYGGGSRPLTATATLNQPFEVEVDAYADDTEDVPPASPQRSGAAPFEGAEVAPVVATAKGFERVDTDDPDTVMSGADGIASIVFDEPGWHRIKATRVGAGGGEDVVRSNRLDVCVPPPPASGCGPLPGDDLVRVPPGTGTEEPDNPGGEGGGTQPGQAGDGAAAAGPSASTSTPGAPAAGVAGQVHLQLQKIDRGRIAQGLVRVSWRVLDAGPGVASWTISSQTLGRKGARYETRAKGTVGTAATLRLPAGAAYRLRIAVLDALGRSSSAQIGRVRVPG